MSDIDDDDDDDNDVGEDKFTSGIKTTSTQKMYSKPDPITDNATSTDKSIFHCLQTLHELEEELILMQQVKKCLLFSIHTTYNNCNLFF